MTQHILLIRPLFSMIKPSRFVMLLFFVITASVSASEPDSWQPEIMDWQTSAIDLSFLNSSERPAGKHGFLKAIGESLVFEDGSPVRFWGANIQARALFRTSDENIVQHAKRLSRLGVNLIRIHHHDSAWVSPNIFNSDTNTLEFNPQSLQKLDRWITSLKREGIYIWLDLQVGREYTANDGIEDFDEVVKDKSRSQFRGFNYYNQSVQQRMQAFNQAYLSHVNQYTGIAYKDDPAIITMLLLNENDLTHHFGNALLPDKDVPAHTQRYRADITKAVKRLGLSRRQAWRAWEFGDAKIYLNDAEHRFYQKMFSHLRQVGVQSLLVPNNSWGGMSIAGLPSLTDGDLIDVHSYGRSGELFSNPLDTANMLNWMAAAQVSGKPLSITEWNVEKFPVEDRYIIAPWLASIASLQSWDAVMLYGYSQDNLDLAGIGRNYSSYNDPALMAMLPAAALLFRQHHVVAAKNHYHLRLSADDFFGKSHTPLNSTSIRTLTEQSKITIDLPYADTLPWLQPYQYQLQSSYDTAVMHHQLNDANISFISAHASQVNSDTGELSRNWVTGIQQINSAQSQIVSGQIGGKTLQLKNTVFNINTPGATVAVQSLDNQPISRSEKILISKIARCSPQQNNAPSPFLCEPVVGKLNIRAGTGLQLYLVSKAGKQAIPAQQDKSGFYQIPLGHTLNSPWLLLSTESGQ